jgi:glutamate synthase domain-containing protein 2
VNIPAFYSKEEQAVSDSVVTAVVAVVAATVVMVVIAGASGGSAASLWSAINTLGISLYLICMNISNVPDNAV